MSFMMTGSIYSYTQNLKLSQKWNTKKTSGNYLQKSDSTQTDSAENSIYSEMEQYRKQLEQIQKQNNPDRATLYAKLQAGKKLSAQEMEYLRTNDPVTYQKAREIETERESYKQKLKRCRTKEDVERLRTTHIAMRLATANSISHNANIPKLTKMQLMAAECAKVKGLEEETRIFKTSQTYAHMPTDAEQRQEEKERMDALTGRTEETEKTEDTGKTEETEKTEEIEKTEGNEKTDVTKKNERTETAEGTGKTKRTDGTDGRTSRADAVSGKSHVQPEHTFSHETQERTLKKEASAVQYHTSYGRKAYQQETGTTSTRKSSGNGNGSRRKSVKA